MTQAIKTPWHLWVVGGLTLLFNLGGAFDYTMTQTRNMEYLQQGADSVNMPVEVFVDYFTSFPIWAHATWALGVWGAFAGSLLLLLRSRFAVPAVAVSIVGLVGTSIYTFAMADMPAELDTTFNWVFSIVIWIVTIGLFFYAKKMRDAGVLR